MNGISLNNMCNIQHVDTVLAATGEKPKPATLDMEGLARHIRTRP